MMEKKLLPTEFAFLTAIKKVLLRIIVITFICVLDYLLLVLIFPLARNPFLSLVAQIAFFGAVVVICYAILRSQPLLHTRNSIAQKIEDGKLSLEQQREDLETSATRFSNVMRDLSLERKLLRASTMYHVSTPIVTGIDWKLRDPSEDIHSNEEIGLRNYELIPVRFALIGHDLLRKENNFPDIRLETVVSENDKDFRPHTFTSHYNIQSKSGKIIIQYKNKNELSETLRYISENLKKIPPIGQFDSEKSINDYGIDADKEKITTSASIQRKRNK